MNENDTSSTGSADVLCIFCMFEEQQQAPHIRAKIALCPMWDMNKWVLLKHRYIEVEELRHW